MKGKKRFFLMWLFIDRLVCCSPFLLSAAPSQAPGKIMWNTSNSKVILKWDQVHALENESEVTGYKVERGRNVEESTLFHIQYRSSQQGIFLSDVVALI